MRKAQVTIFIILGILILVVFFIIMSLQSSISSEQRRVIRSAKTQLESASVNIYVTSCLEKSLESAVLKLAENGFWLYDVAGCSADDCTGAGNIQNTSYGLTLHPDIEAVPKYPCLDRSTTWPFCKFA